MQPTTDITYDESHADKKDIQCSHDFFAEFWMFDMYKKNSKDLSMNFFKDKFKRSINLYNPNDHTEVMWHQRWFYILLLDVPNSIV